MTQNNIENHHVEIFHRTKQKKWLQILDDITFDYNNSVNGSIKMKPSQVTKEKKGED